MTDPNINKPLPAAEPEESFSEIFAQYEKAHPRKRNEPGQGLTGTVVAVNGDSVIFDLGRKEEGIIALAEFTRLGEAIKPGDQVQVTITGRDPEGFLTLARGRVAKTTDWSSLEKAFADRFNPSLLLRPGFNVVRSDPRFQELVRRIGRERLVLDLSCRSTNWVAPERYEHLCYSDIPFLYQLRGFADGWLPYIDTGTGRGPALEYPVLTGVFMQVGSWLTGRSGSASEIGRAHV